ncbi:MAG: ABC transporter permease [Anaerolineae bacterium]|nr:ABC transporter permease [Anaerolineales bacterium]MCQ3976505.1 ABC transporter permease [Anaerolineae bacterium]
MDIDAFIALLHATIRLTTPLLFAAIGGLFSERSGVINIALEGKMLLGALIGFMIAYSTGNPWLGLLGAMVAGAIVALLFAYVTVTLGADQIVTAVAINLIMVGLTGVVFRLMKAANSGSLSAPTFPVWNIPLLSDIPFVGPLFFSHLPLVYLAFLLVPLASFVFYRTTWGLAVRAVGEHPRAADTLGVKVPLVRYLCIIWSGMMAAVGGVVLSIGFNSTFIENMIAGRGFIAFSAIVFGKWTPLGTMLASLLFGFADAFQLRIQAGILAPLGIPEIPYQFPVMLPYVVTLVALFFTGRMHWPAAAAIPYKREEA